VDFDLSEDQRALKEAAAGLLAGHCPTSRLRALAAEGHRLDAELWRALAGQGWLAVEVPEVDGGLGLGLVELAVLGEEVGRSLAPVPFAGTVLVAGALRSAVDAGVVAPGTVLGDAELSTWIERLTSGAAMGAVAWSRRQDAVRASGSGGEWKLSGRADPVVYGPEADVVVVFADDGDGSALFALSQVPHERPEAEPAMDLTRSLGWLHLDGRPALRLGGADAAGRVLDRAAVVVSAEMLGAAGRVLELSVDYAKDRVQFGRPIGSFQAVKHRCADMLVDVEGMRSAAYYAAWAVGARSEDGPAAASAAKVWCSDASRRVMASALQVHGGIGFTWEHDLHLYVKRAQLDQTSFGDASWHRQRLVGILRPRAERGEPIL